MTSRGRVQTRSGETGSMLLLSTDFYNLAPRGVKNLILYEIALVLYI